MNNISSCGGIFLNLYRNDLKIVCTKLRNKVLLLLLSVNHAFGRQEECVNEYLSNKCDCM